MVVNKRVAVEVEIVLNQTKYQVANWKPSGNT